ncbi:MAG: pyridoxal-phosphate dependent enzyme [Algicola sp.]|nr:pyridoxal-phosphate dependent enzyme [Algicola sp.]
MTSLHINTPLIEAPGMSQSSGSKVWLKMEALQPSGSFKNRGVGFACQAHQARGAKALVSSSGGNAGLAVAYSGRQLGMPVTVVVPESTKQRAIDLMNQQGAKVIITGKIWDEAHQHAMTLPNDQTAYIHPFDDPLLWEGHASIIDEVVEAGVNPDAVVLSVGGGGLLCGVIEGLKRNGLNNTPVVAVETQGAHSLSTAITARQHIGIDNIDSIATSLGAKIVAKQAFELSQEYPISSHVVSDKQAVDACCRFVDDHRILVEPACGASLAVVYEGCEALKDKRNILVIVCGGVGVSLAQLRQWRG